MVENKLFLSYSHLDSAHARQFLTHLDPLKRDGTLHCWYDRCIRPGDDWRGLIEAEMEAANIGVFLVSANFLASKFCQDVEVPYLLEKHEREGTIIVPVIVDDCLWQEVDWISRINVLPTDGRPVRSHRPQSKAWTQVSKELRNLAIANARKESSPAVKKSLPSTPAKVETPKKQPPALSLGHLLEELPGSTDELFGREEDLEFLDAAFRNPNIGVVAILAFGGVGKSALVRYWLTHNALEANVRFVGCSFYSQGTREHAGTSDQFLVNTLRALGDPEPNRGPLWMRGRRLAEMVAAEPTILVLDGLEPLQFGPGIEHREGHLKDAGIRELLAGMIENSGRSLCIVTSRLPLTDASLRSPRLVQRSLDMLPPRAARELLRYRGVQGSDAELDRAAEHLGRHALALVLAAEYLYTFEEGEVSHIHKISLINEQIKAGRHAKSVMAAYEVSLRRDGNLLDIELLHVLGLFDRPAMWQWIETLRRPPVIPGVTEEIVRATEQELWEAISRLRQWGLMASSGLEGETDLDAHPLIREYFGERLRLHNEAGWRQAHQRLFEHLSHSGKELPDTLDEMMPLLVGVVHGCKAGLYRDALRNVYLPRIMRGEQFYAAHKLGALGSLLSVLIHFFKAGDWRYPVSADNEKVQGLNEADQVTVLTHAGMCLTAARGYAAPEVEQCYAQARDLCLRVGETRDLFIALFGLWRYYLVRGDGQKTKELATRLYDLSQKLGDNRISAAGERVMSSTLYYQGENVLAVEHAQKGVKLRRTEEMLSSALLFLNEPTISCLGYWAMALWHLGDPDQAREKIQEAVVLSHQLAHPHTLAITLLFDTMLAQFCGDAMKTREKAEELNRLCAQEGFALWQVAGEILHGWSQTKLEHQAAGLEQLESGLNDWENSGAKLFRIYWLALLAEAYGRCERVNEGIRLLDEGLLLADLNGESWWASDLYRLKGELLLKLGRKEEAKAEQYFLKAREVAKRQSALSLELRAATSCSRLWYKQGRKQEAQTLLTELYEKFTSGRDTADLKEAQTLLGELSNSTN